MKKNPLLMFLPLSALLFGCAQPSGLAGDATALALEVAPTEVVTLSQVSGRISGRELLLSGKVRRYYPVPFPGHVDVKILDSEGRTVLEQQADIPGLLSARRGVMDLPFLVRVDGEPPGGAVVRLRYHGPPFDEGQDW